MADKRRPPVGMENASVSRTNDDSSGNAGRSATGVSKQNADSAGKTVDSGYVDNGRTGTDSQPSVGGVGEDSQAPDDVSFGGQVSESGSGQGMGNAEAIMDGTDGYSAESIAQEAMAGQSGAGQDAGSAAVEDGGAGGGYAQAAQGGAQVASAGAKAAAGNYIGAAKDGIEGAKNLKGLQSGDPAMPGAAGASGGFDGQGLSGGSASDAALSGSKGKGGDSGPGSPNDGNSNGENDGEDPGAEDDKAPSQSEMNEAAKASSKNNDKPLKKMAKYGSMAIHAVQSAMHAAFWLKLMAWLLQMMQMAAAIIAAAAASLLSLITTVVTAIVQTVAMVLGISVAVATFGVVATAIGIVFLVGAIIVAAVSGASDIAEKDDGDCIEEEIIWYDTSDLSITANEELNAYKIWFTLSQAGFSHTQISGILGNFASESGVDATGSETIYNDPYCDIRSDTVFKVDHVYDASGAKVDNHSTADTWAVYWTEHSDDSHSTKVCYKGMYWLGRHDDCGELYYDDEYESLFKDSLRQGSEGSNACVWWLEAGNKVRCYECRYWHPDDGDVNYEPTAYDEKGNLLSGAKKTTHGWTVCEGPFNECSEHDGHIKCEGPYEYCIHGVNKTSKCTEDKYCDGSGNKGCNKGHIGCTSSSCSDSKCTSTTYSHTLCGSTTDTHNTFSCTMTIEYVHASLCPGGKNDATCPTTGSYVCAGGPNKVYKHTKCGSTTNSHNSCSMTSTTTTVCDHSGKLACNRGVNYCDGTSRTATCIGCVSHKKTFDHVNCSSCASDKGRIPTDTVYCDHHYLVSEIHCMKEDRSDPKGPSEHPSDHCSHDAEKCTLTGVFCEHGLRQTHSDDYDYVYCVNGQKVCEETRYCPRCTAVLVCKNHSTNSSVSQCREQGYSCTVADFTDNSRCECNKLHWYWSRTAANKFECQSHGEKKVAGIHCAVGDNHSVSDFKYCEHGKEKTNPHCGGDAAHTVHDHVAADYKYHLHLIDGKQKFFSPTDIHCEKGYSHSASDFNLGGDTYFSGCDHGITSTSDTSVVWTSHDCSGDSYSSCSSTHTGHLVECTCPYRATQDHTRHVAHSFDSNIRCVDNAYWKEHWGSGHDGLYHEQSGDMVYHSSRMGFGLGQWSLDRQKKLLEYTYKDGTGLSDNPDNYKIPLDDGAGGTIYPEWYSIELQLVFMLDQSSAGDDGAKWLMNWGEPSNVEQATYDFFVYWEGIGSEWPNQQAVRTKWAQFWYKKIDAWIAGEVPAGAEDFASTATSIIDMAHATGMMASDRANKERANNCYTTPLADNSSLARAAVQYAWPDKAHSTGNDGTPLYQLVHDAVLQNDKIYRACCRNVSTAVRWSGTDADYKPGGVAEQYEYVYSRTLGSNPSWVEVNRPNGSYLDLLPGDVLMVTPALDIRVGDDARSHTVIFVGHETIVDIWNSYDGPLKADYQKAVSNPNVMIVAGSLSKKNPASSRSPALEEYHASEYDPGLGYLAFRCIRPNPNPDYTAVTGSVTW